MHVYLGDTLRALSYRVPPLTHAQVAGLIGIPVSPSRAWLSPRRHSYVSLDRECPILDSPCWWKPLESVRPSEPLCCRLSWIYGVECGALRMSVGVLPSGMRAWCSGHIDRSLDLWSELLGRPSTGSSSYGRLLVADPPPSDADVDILGILAGDDD